MKPIHPPSLDSYLIPYLNVLFSARAMKSAAGSGESPMVFAARLVAARPKNAGVQEDFPTHSAYARQRAAAGRSARVGAGAGSGGCPGDGRRADMRSEGTEHGRESTEGCEREDGRLVHSMRPGPGRLSSGPVNGEGKSTDEGDDDQAVGGDSNDDDDDDDGGGGGGGGGGGRERGSPGSASHTFMPEPDGARRPLSRGAVKRTGATDFLEQARKELRAKQSMAPPDKVAHPTILQYKTLILLADALVFGLTKLLLYSITRVEQISEMSRLTFACR
jgi:hypothetical protein